ncbi:MAG: hypothetical protein GY749_38290, partial [Desulfobacteraceae bacterium]|nr:hypothetical protein [Desulfobacteraceae bacterium]
PGYADADVDANGKVDIDDALMIARYDVGLISGFASKVYDGTETRFSLVRGGANQFLLPVEIGNQTFNLLADTGSDALLVFEDKIDDSNRSVRRSESPISVSDTKISKSYSSGTRSGVLAFADVRIGAFSASQMRIMVIQNPGSHNDPSLTPKGADGIIGLRRTGGLNFSPQADSLDAPLNVLIPAVGAMEFDLPPSGEGTLSFGNMPNLERADTRFVFRGKALSVADTSDMTGQKNFSDLQVPFRAKSSAGEANGEDLDILLDTGAVSRLVLDTQVAEKLGYNPDSGKWEIGDSEEIELNLIGENDTVTLYPKFKVWEVSVAPYRMMGVEFEAVLGISRWQEYVVGFDFVPHHNGGPDGTISLLRRLDMNDALSDEPPALSEAFVELPGLNSVGNDETPAADDTGDTVVFQSDREGGMGGKDIYVWKKGQGILDLPGLNSAGEDANPVITGDGRHIVFQSDREGGSDVYLYDLDQKAFVSLPGLNSQEADNMPCISRDGGYIAFASRRDGAGGSDVYLYDISSKQMISLPGLNTEADELSPFIGENGGQLAFAVISGSDPITKKETEDISIYDVREQRMLTLSDGMRGVNSVLNEQNPALTADGSLMAFHSNRRNPEMGLYDRDILLIDMEMQIPVQQPGLSSDFDETCPRFTGNGNMVVFQSRRPGGEGGSDIYMYRMGQTAAAVPGEQKESVALTRTDSGLFTAPVIVGGKNVNLAVDTAFSGLLVFRDAVSGLSLTETGEPATLGMGTGQVTGMIAKADVSASDRNAGDMRIIIAERGDVSKNLEGFQNLQGSCDGIFGLYINASSHEPPLDGEPPGGNPPGGELPPPAMPDSPMMALLPAINLTELNLDPEGPAGMSLGTMPLVGGVSEHLSWHTSVHGQTNPHDPANSFTNMAVPFIATVYAAGSDTPAAYFGKADSYEDGKPLSRAVPGALIQDRIVIDTSVAEELGYDPGAGTWGEINRISISLVMYGSDALLPVAREIPVAKTDVADLSGESYGAVIGSDYWNSYILGFDTADYQNDGPAGVLFMVRRQDAAASDALAGTDHHFTELPGLNSIADDMMGDVSDDGQTLVFQSSRAGGAGETDIYVYRIGEGILELPGLNGPGYDREPSLNGDGSLVAFESDRNGGSDIFLYDIAARAFAELPGLNTEDPELTPDISADGTRLAYQSVTFGDNEKPPKLKIYDIENKSVLRTPSVMSTNLEDSEPSLGEDGRLIAFARSAGRGENLRIYDGRRGRMRQLPEHLNSPFVEGSWNLSSDGNFVAFFSNRNDPDDGHVGKDILLADLTSEELLFLPSLNSGFEEGGPALSRNAEYVLFHSKRPGGKGGYDIYLYQRDTEDDTPYTVTAEYTEDGYVQGGSRMIANAEVRATDGEGNVIASTVTGEDGHFTMTIPAGSLLPVRYETGASNAEVVVDEVGDDTYVPDFEAGNLKFTDVWVEDTMQSGFATKIWFDVETETPKYNTFVKLYLVNLPTGSVDDLDISGGNFRPDYSLTGLFIENLGHAGPGDPVTGTQDSDTVTEITYLSEDNTMAHVEHSFRIPAHVEDGTYAAVFSIGRFDYHSEDDALQSEDSADRSDNFMVAPASVIIGQPDKPNLRILSAKLNTNSLVLPNNPPAETSAPAQSDLSLNMEVESMSRDTEEAVDIVFGLEIDGTTYPLSIGASRGRKIVKTDKKTYEVSCRSEGSRCASLFRQEQQGHTYKLYLGTEAYDALASKASDTLCNLIVTVDPDGNVDEWEDNKADNVKEMPVMFLAASKRKRRFDTTECSNSNLVEYDYGYECNFFENNVGISNPSGGEVYGNSTFNVGYSFGCDMSYEMDASGDYPTAAQFDAMSEYNQNKIYVTVFGYEQEILGIGVGFDVDTTDIGTSYFGYKAYVLGLSEWSSISEFIQNSAYDGEVTENANGEETYSGSIDVDSLLSLEAGTTYYSFCGDPDNCSDFEEAEIWNTQNDDGNEKYSLSKSFEQEKTFSIAGIPITVAGGITGELGIRGSISVAANNKLILAAGPYASVTGFAEGSVGVSGIQAGVGINLLILEVSLDLSPSIQILPSIPAAIFGFETPFTISTLDGEFYAFAITKFKFLGVNVELEYTYTILEWEGLSYQIDLFDPYKKTWMEADTYLTQYYSDAGFSNDSGDPTTEDIIYHDWGSNPTTPDDNDFSVYWNGWFNLDDGDYTFTAETDDNSTMDVFIDGSDLTLTALLEDTTVNGYDGKLNDGNPTWSEDDDVFESSESGSIYFDGTTTNNYVNLNDYAENVINTKKGTIEHWIKLDKDNFNDSSEWVMLYLGNVSDGNGFGGGSRLEIHTAVNKGDFYFVFQDGNSTSVLIQTTGIMPNGETSWSIASDTWYHIAATYDTTTSPNSWAIYIHDADSTLLESVTLSENTTFDEQTPTFCRFGIPGANTRRFSGHLDEMRTWNYALSQVEIETNLTTRLTGDEDGLLAYYQMDSSTSKGGEQSIDSDSLVEIGVEYAYDGTGTFDAQASFYWTRKNAFTGDYYNSEDLSGDSAWTNVDEEIDFYWGESSPNPDVLVVNEEDDFSFSVIWNGVFDFDYSDTYVFLVESDDSGVSLSIDSSELTLIEMTDSDGVGIGIYYATASVTDGSHSITVEYHHSTGDAYIDVDWQLQDTWSYEGITTKYKQIYYSPVVAGVPFYEASIDDEYAFSGFLEKTDFNDNGTVECDSEDTGIKLIDNVVPYNTTTTTCYYNATISYKGIFEFSDAGDYMFIARAAFGMKIYIDGTEYMGAWELESAEAFKFSVSLTAGYHLVEVEYSSENVSAEEVNAGNRPDLEDLINWVRELDWYLEKDNQFTAYYYRTYEDMVADDNWDSDSYNDDESDAHPLLIRKEDSDLNNSGLGCYWTSSSITCDWESSSPTFSLQPIDSDLDSLNNDGKNKFGARWIGDFNFDESAYVFTAAADDGVQVWVDNVLTIDEMQSQSTKTFQEAVYMSYRTHPIRIEYWENTGGADLAVSWEAIDYDTFNVQYFDSSNLTGSPTDGGTATSISKDWGSGSPDTTISSDGFSARWVGVFDFEEAEYDFSVTTDGGVRVYLDGSAVIDQWSAANTSETYTVTESMIAGYHSIKVEYYHDSGDNAAISLSWAGQIDLFGYALEFDGTDDYVDLGESGPVLGNTFTQEAWIYPTHSDTSFHGFLGYSPNLYTRSPGIWCKGQQIHYGFGNGESWLSTTSDSVLTLNAWNHVAVTFDGSDYMLYVNGEQVHNYTGASGETPYESPVRYIGRTNNYFEGMIDEVRIWGTARSETEIQSYIYTPLNGTEDNLTAYYNFDEGSGTDLADSAGSYGGTLYNSPTWETSTVVLDGMIAPGNALEFDGTDDYVEVSYSDALNSSVFTVETWAKVDGGSGTWRSVMTSRDNFPQRGFIFYASTSDNWQFWIGNGSTWPKITGSSVVTGEWTHLAGVYDGTTMTFYINGVSAGSLDADLSLNTEQPLRIGAGSTESETPDFYFNGSIDEVRIWNTARTESEIMVYMNRPLTGYENGLAAYYQFDKVSGSTLPDFTGGNDGTLYNSPSWVTSGATLSEYSQPGNAMSFDGTDDYVDINDSVTDLAYADFTMEAWIKTTRTSSSQSIIVKQDGDTSWEAGEKSFYTSASGTVNFVGWGNSYIKGTTAVNDGDWHHVAVVWDYTAETGYIYVDGVDDTSSSTYNANKYDNDGDTLKIGDPNYSEGYNHFEGQIDELRIWSTARTQDEIQDNMYSTVLDTESYLEAYYRFDQSDGDELIDLTDNAHDGTISGDPSWVTSGAFSVDPQPGYALEFDGTDDYVEVPADTLNDQSSGTIETWAYFDAVADEVIFAKQHDGVNSYSIFSVGFTATTGGMTQSGTSGYLYFHPRNSSQNATSTSTVSAGIWTHVAVTFDSTQATFYIDGTEAGTTSGDFSIPDDLSPTSTSIGAWVSHDHYLDGQMDELRIWSTARTEDEIQTYMNTTVLGTESYLEAYYRFDQSSGDELIDLTANDHDGTLSGDPTWTTSGADIE